ncbi:MAG: glycosyltransferase family 2 protein [PVC group bacterium]
MNNQSKSKPIVSRDPLVTIIIAFRHPGEYVRESLEKIGELDYRNFEVILLPDEHMEEIGPEITIIPTGPVGPPRKRDIGAEQARGEILAFIDDDAHPLPDWLKRAVPLFSDDSIAAVGGPAMTPPEDDLSRQAGGRVLSSFMVGGFHSFRSVPDKKRLVDDYPTSNLLVRKTAFMRVGGFNSPYWPGEDTVLCWKLTHEAGMKILYDPDVRVWHHRRPLFKKHWNQLGNYGLHRGYFARKFPRTSRRFTYFLPSLWTAFLFLGWLPLLFIPGGIFLYAAAVLLYFLAALVTGVSSRNLKMTFMVAAGIVTTHVVYGLNFMRGLLIKQLPEE